MTFPGKASSVSGDGEKSGNTVTWKHAERETRDLKATGAGRGTPYVAIILVILVLLALTLKLTIFFSFFPPYIFFQYLDIVSKKL